jgi:hypothetical protein
MARYTSGDAAGRACVASAPIACTLELDEVPQRIEGWRDLLSHARDRVWLADGGLRIELDADVSVATLAQLVADEQRCCAFLAFAITVDARGVALEVQAPEGAHEIVETLFADQPRPPRGGRVRSSRGTPSSSRR